MENEDHLRYYNTKHQKQKKTKKQKTNKQTNKQTNNKGNAFTEILNATISYATKTSRLR